MEDPRDIRSALFGRSGLRLHLFAPISLFALVSSSGCGSSSSSNGKGTGGASSFAGAGGATPGAAGGGAGGSAPTGAGGAAGALAGGSGPGGAIPSGGGAAGTPVPAAGGEAGGSGAGAGGASAGGTIGDAGPSDAATGGACSRALLVQLRDAYFTAIAAHDPSMLPTAPTVKFTENGKETALGDGFWKTAGAVKFERSALDTEACDSVTESVVTEGSTDIVFGLRLGVAAGKVAEIESIVVRQGDYFSNPSALAASASDDWETVLAPDQQPTKDALQGIVKKYFTQFPAGACNFAADCKRLENGFSPGSCTAGLSCSMSNSPGGAGMTPRLYLYDREAGIAVGFVMFAGAYTDFHMFKVRDGQVHGVHATLATASSSGW